MSDHASGTYRVLNTREDVFGYHHATCRRVGLTLPASSETLFYYPEALCSGAAIVTVTPRCAGSKCTVFAEVTR